MRLLSYSFSIALAILFSYPTNVLAKQVIGTIYLPKLKRLPPPLELLFIYLSPMHTERHTPPTPLST